MVCSLQPNLCVFSSAVSAKMVLEREEASWQLAWLIKQLLACSKLSFSCLHFQPPRPCQQPSQPPFRLIMQAIGCYQQRLVYGCLWEGRISTSARIPDGPGQSSCSARPRAIMKLSAATSLRLFSALALLWPSASPSVRGRIGSWCRQTDADAACPPSPPPKAIRIVPFTKPRRFFLAELDSPRPILRDFLNLHAATRATARGPVFPRRHTRRTSVSAISRAGGCSIRFAFPDGHADRAARSRTAEAVQRVEEEFVASGRAAVPQAMVGRKRVSRLPGQGSYDEDIMKGLMGNKDPSFSAKIGDPCGIIGASVGFNLRMVRSDAGLVRGCPSRLARSVALDLLPIYKRISGGLASCEAGGPYVAGGVLIGDYSFGL
ncbi:hypothetical protein MAPG_00240 [Magnaporthiopsis poae ATCC 64411]|uniref:Uncharacterized protein n=1 Tax=Magnaporthiopsis poae (strain ATCC 64411 / 73-15) TaxID=644358 RepID=A0A0C4DKG8_MAGP6|nr:hypothetical protein MAPG_00240 [Magnaporthiopsis poae ATCC 64411]